MSHQRVMSLEIGRSQRMMPLMEIPIERGGEEAAWRLESAHIENLQIEAAIRAIIDRLKAWEIVTAQSNQLARWIASHERRKRTVGELGISIPFSQRDFHFAGDHPGTVRIASEEQPAQPSPSET